MGFVLFILSVVLSALLFPLGIVSGLIQSFYQVQPKTGLKNTDKKFLVLAKSVDKFGNVICSELFNAALIKKNGHQFGRIEETISMVLGYNLQEGTLTTRGKVLVFILTKKHCLNAIKNDK